MLNEDINGNISIQNFDMGSYWIDIALGGKEVLLFAGALVFSAAAAYSHVQKGRLHYQETRKLKLENDIEAKVKAGIEKQDEEAKENEANYLMQEYFKDKKDNDQKERLKLAIDKLIELYEKGAEFHPQLNAPDDVQKAFPDFENLMLIESKIKKLKEGKNRK